ncbi:Dihydroxyacetone kinase 2 [Thoreauomyces humboldtii]|nr:Dihydroxyacetone kinase 2 [Thoreauomyces humboldtii]
MTTKHVINGARDLVNESLTGLSRLNPALSIDQDARVAYLTTINQDRVALISGGGSGHEPAHAGFVGDGVLSAAVCGNVFASPNVGQIRKAIHHVKNKKGTLAVVKQYTGDVLLFGLAKEQHNVTSPEYPLRMTIVGDDVAVPRTQGSLVGRRGLAGTVLVYKIASAVASTGADVDEVHAMAEYIATRVGTIGVGLNHCHVPGTEISADNHLKDDEVEIGMGIHNESGISKEKLTSSAELIKKMLAYVTDINDVERAFLPFKHDGNDEVVLLVNNLGGISELEMSAIANDAVKALTEQNITVERLLVGTFMTSLNLPGFSLTLLLLPRAGEAYKATKIIKLLDADATAPGWGFAAKSKPGQPEKSATDKHVNGVNGVNGTIKNGAAPIKFTNFPAFETAVLAAAENVIKAEAEITRYDTIAGDGDCGLTLKAGAEGVSDLFKHSKIDKNDAVTAVLQIAAVVEKTMDGTSGALYSIWMNALAAGLAKGAKQINSTEATPEVTAIALSHALETLFTYTPARIPSRTLVDPLQAFTEVFAASKGADFAGAVQAATQAAEKTKDMVAKVGRAAYVGREELQKAQVPDPGAWGVVKLLQGLQSSK